MAMPRYRFTHEFKLNALHLVLREKYPRVSGHLRA